jgi:hypothetical protein
MIFQKLGENVKIRMHFSAKILFFWAQLAWPAELSSSAGGGQLNFGAEFQLSCFNQFLPGPSWLKPVELAWWTGWTGLCPAWPRRPVHAGLSAAAVSDAQDFFNRSHPARARSIFFLFWPIAGLSAARFFLCRAAFFLSGRFSTALSARQ